MANPGPMNWLKRQTTPVTIVLIALIVLGGLLSWSNPKAIYFNMIFDGDVLPKVWTLLTYPYFGYFSPIGHVFLSLWLFSIGGIVEREHRTKRYILLWLAFTVLSVIPLAIVGAPVVNAYIPVAAITVTWATRHPREIVRLMCLFPVPAWFVAALSVAIVFFDYAASGNMILHGFLACLSCGIAYLYASNRIPKLTYGYSAQAEYNAYKKSKAQVQKEEKYFSDVARREIERAEKERLRKLFEGSIDDK